MIRLRMIVPLALISAGSLAMSGCAATVAFLGVKAGTTIAQDRTIGTAIDDATINTDYNTRLARERSDLYRHVNVKVVEGRILLTGHVATDADRTSAGRIAWAIPGVRAVANELAVGQSKTVGSAVNDVWISNQLRGKLMTDGNIAWVNYNISTVDGTVYLLGVAKNESELERVTLHARTIPGVKKVVSYVELKGAEQRRASL